MDDTEMSESTAASTVSPVAQSSATSVTEQFYHNAKGIYRILSYLKAWIVIVDGADPADTTSEHARATSIIKRLFEECSNYNVTTLRLAEDSTESDWSDRWDQMLERMGKDDLMVIYYHGIAYGSGEGWRWRFEGSPQQPINAYAFIQKLNESKVDFLLILDCWMPSRFKIKWKRSIEKNGNTEIMRKGESEPNTFGIVNPRDYEFTKALNRNVRSYLNTVSEKPSWKAPRSILEVMCADTRILVTRVKMLPWEIRNNGRLEFYRVQVQDMVERWKGYGFLRDMIQACRSEQECGRIRIEDGPEDLAATLPTLDEDEGIGEDGEADIGEEEEEPFEGKEFVVDGGSDLFFPDGE